MKGIIYLRSLKPFLEGKKFVGLLFVGLVFPLCKNLIIAKWVNKSPSETNIMFFQEILTSALGNIISRSMGMDKYKILPTDTLSIIKISIISGIMVCACLLLIKIIIDHFGDSGA